MTGSGPFADGRLTSELITVADLPLLTQIRHTHEVQGPKK